MSEFSQTSHENKLNHSSNSYYSTNIDADTNMIIANAREAIAVIISLIPNDQIYNFERIMKVLRKLNDYEKQVNEFKHVHNMLHELEITLILLNQLTSTIVKKIDLNAPMLDSNREKNVNEDNWWSMKKHWMIAVVPGIQKIKDFASQDMRFLEEPNFVQNGDIRVGPVWILGLLALQDEIETNLEEQNTHEIHELAAEMLDECRHHLFNLDRSLLNVISQLDQLSDQLLRSINDQSTKP